MGRILLFLVIAVIILVPMWYFNDALKKRKNASQPQQTDDNEAELDESDIDSVLPPDGKCSPTMANCCVTEDYRHANSRAACAKALAADAQLRYLWSKLEKVNPENVHNRQPDAMDKWFIDNVEEFVKYGEVMAFIEYHPALEDLFLDSLNEPWNNVELQKRIISVCRGSYQVNYVNLLCKYLCRWDLVSPVKAVVFYDPRFARAKIIYDTYYPSRHKRRRHRNKKTKTA
ncbi:MAG: hypothetical protein IJ770_02575 [Alphaproteobacteria bacterium]|nr:hypothetical protein [Alphaproteobacteria bacterium]